MRNLLPVAFLCLILCLDPSQCSTVSPQTFSTDNSTGSSVSGDTSTGSSVSGDTSTGSSVSGDTSTGSSVSGDTSTTGSGIITDTSTNSSSPTDMTGWGTASTNGDITTTNWTMTESTPMYDNTTTTNWTMTDSTPMYDNTTTTNWTMTDSTPMYDNTTTTNWTMTDSTPMHDNTTTTNWTMTDSTPMHDNTTTTNWTMTDSTPMYDNTTTSNWTMTDSTPMYDNTTTTNWTMTDSSPMSESTATTVTTMPSTTTTTVAPFNLQHNTDLAMYTLQLMVRPDNMSDIRYLDPNMTKQSLQDDLSPYFQNFSFKVDLVNDPNSTSTNIYQLRITLLYQQLDNDTELLESWFKVALQNIGDMPEYDLPNENRTYSAVASFLKMTQDICQAQNVCPPGFTCNPQGCLHLCSSSPNFCNNNGACYTTITSSAEAQLMCQCNSEYDIEYTGDQCQYSRRGRLQIIAIIAGVLGAACLIFIVIIIIMCVLINRGKSASKYNLSDSAYVNNAYDNSHFK